MSRSMGTPKKFITDYYHSSLNEMLDAPMRFPWVIFGKSDPLDEFGLALNSYNSSLHHGNANDVSSDVTTQERLTKLVGGASGRSLWEEPRDPGGASQRRAPGREGNHTRNFPNCKKSSFICSSCLEDMPFCHVVWSRSLLWL